MPKFSVYVPDSLWERVQANLGEINMSHVTQEALRALVAGDVPGGPFVRERRSVDVKRLERIRHRYNEEAQRFFEEGQDIGLQLAENLSVDQLARMKRGITSAGLAVVPGDRAMYNALGAGDIFDVIEQTAKEALGEDWLNKLGKGSVRAQGVIAALNEVWEYVTATVDEKPGEGADQ